MEHRKIKFKAKRIDNAEWVEGNLVNTTSNGSYIAYEMSKTTFPLAMAEVDPSTVCQFTGLKDKDGKDIFEGDLLAEKSFPMYEIGYINGEFAASYIGENTFIFKLSALSKDCVACGSRYDRKEGEK